MVQAEVANRIVADPGSSPRGALSVIAQSRCRVEIVHRLAPSAFYPQPRVRSAVVVFEPLSSPLFRDKTEERQFDKVVRVAFSGRRKTMRRALSIGGMGSLEQTTRLLADADIDPGVRPARLSVADFRRLARARVVDESS